jgi:type I restriction enzyme M protein
MLFYKRLSDTWLAEKQTAVSELREAISERAEADYHSFTIPPGCLWTEIRQVAEGINNAVSKALMEIERANPKLSGIFSSIQWGNTDQLPESALIGLIRALSVLDLSPGNASQDVIGRAYEYLLNKFAADAAKKAGEFYTPRDVVRFLVRVTNPHLDEEIMDPTCGSGGMLLEAIQEVRDKGEDHRSMRLYGQEIRPETAVIAKINMFLHGMDMFDIQRGDTLRDPAFIENGKLRQFDVVLSNPPFSLKNWGHEDWATDRWGRCVGGVPPKGYGDYAFVQHIVASLKPDGRAAVVMNHGVLFRGGQEQKIRQWLVEQDLLDAVIDIPRNLFYATTIPNSVFVIRKSKTPDRQGRVLFVDGTRRVQEGKKINDMSEEDINALVETYESGAEADDVRCRLVEHAELKENDYSFNFGVYLPSEDEGERINVGKALMNWRAAHEKAEEARVKMERMLG